MSAIASCTYVKVCNVYMARFSVLAD